MTYKATAPKYIPPNFELASSDLAKMDAATIEETNRIRVSLGMKPLPVPGAEVASDSDSEPDEERGSTLETREAEGGDNYKKYLDDEANKRRREQRAAATRRARELAQRNIVLDGKGLGEADAADAADARAWLTGQKKRQKKIDKARKLEAELAVAEAAAAAAVQYTSKDLAGIKVGHDMSAFLDGDEQILTLKDAAIDANDEEDELENVAVREQESLNDKLDVLKQRPGYNPMDGEESSGILAQYDEEISGKKRKRFTLDETGMNAELADILSAPAAKKTQQNVSLDDIVGDGTQPSSDYLDASQIKIKKPKKKKSKQTRQKQQDEDDIFPSEPVPEADNEMDVDSKDGIRKKPKSVSDTFVDDDDLQASLATQRRNALKKRKKIRPEDLAKMLKEQGDQEDGLEAQQDGGLVIGAVSEFVSGLAAPEEVVRKPKRSPSPKRKAKPEEHGEDHVMEDLDDAQVHETEYPEPQEQQDQAEEEEKMVGSGMGAALSLLRERGLVEASKGDEEHAAFRGRQDFLAQKRRLEEELDAETRRQRERDRASGKLDRMSVREREEYARQQNQWRDQQQSRRVAELFAASYQPTVALKYRDELGRDLDTKDAFKHLSHHFHGKSSGNMKQQKLLKKMEEDRRREAQSMFDASQSAGMSRATAQQLKKRKEAGVRLG
ncbi:DNA binding protein SART-1 [Cordyceps fumosorosea ARSEF 2679]|uniref:DNA binding protein SART-1 n=1 Tax=Cordyceps fumosorosea (strain ARSEF 2679) TaxID=1081104 RepID=A0A168CB73_CORFA|nr:DNA binding protein SART-1 [Cordyceps fumosorosea ARSEF 2679]OAA71180.1 DNA binding protein SART-1 [Cordyceps fumosorosea ARSEF 2679]